MRKALFFSGGLLQAGLVVLHVSMSLAFAKSQVPLGLRGLLQVFNVQVTAVLIFFVCVSLFRRRDLETTGIGRLVTALISGFYLLRAANQFFFLTPAPAIVGLCLLLAAIYAIPAALGPGAAAAREAGLSPAAPQAAA